MHTRKRTADILIVALITLLIFLPAAEIALRVSCAYCTWTERTEGRFVSPYDTTETSWYLVNPPNREINLSLPEFDYQVKTNSLGFRDIEHVLEKPEGDVRLVAVGDSFTEGWGARFERTWLSELGTIVNTEPNGTQFTMINGGVAGSDPFYNYRSLMDKLLYFGPDIVLLVVNNSDVIDYIRRGGLERFNSDGTLRGVDAPEAPWLYRWSHLARFILFEFFDYTHLLLTKPERDRKADQAVAKLMELVSLYDNELAARGIEFYLVVVPHHNELMKNRYERLAPLLEYAAKKGINTIDTRPYLHDKLEEHEHSLDIMYWPIDMHFTELGYRYFAEAIEIGLRPAIARARSPAGPPARSATDE